MKAELLGDSEEKLALLTFWGAAFCAGVESVAIGMALPESRGLGADSVWLHFWGALSGMFAEMGDNTKTQKEEGMEFITKEDVLQIFHEDGSYLSDPADISPDKFCNETPKAIRDSILSGNNNDVEDALEALKRLDALEKKLYGE